MQQATKMRHQRHHESQRARPRRNPRREIGVSHIAAYAKLRRTSTGSEWRLCFKHAPSKSEIRAPALGRQGSPCAADLRT